MASINMDKKVLINKIEKTLKDKKKITQIDGKTTSAYNKKLDTLKKGKKNEKSLQKLLEEIEILSPTINTKAKVKNEIKERKKENVFVSKNQIDKIKFFTKYSFIYKNVKTVKDLYNNIYKELNIGVNNQPFTSVSLFLRNKESGNKVRSFSIPAGDLTNYNDFKERLDKISKGNAGGSDPINYDEDELILTNFSLSQAKIAGSGSSDKMLFKTEGIEESKSINKKTKKECGNRDCAYQCLKHCGIDYKGDIKKLSNIDNLIEYIEENCLRIDVIYNSFLIKRNINSIINDNGAIIKMIKDKKGEERKNICTKLNIENDIDIVYAYKNKKFKSKYTIIYDEFNEHYDVIKNNVICLDDDVYINNCFKVIKNDKIIFTPKQINENSKVKPETSVEITYLFFDYETVIDFNESSCMKPYSLSILELNNYDLITLTKADEEENIEKIKEIRQRCCKTFLGYDCSEKFIEWIIKNQHNKAFIFIGYNNANFDNFLLLEALLKYQENNIDNEYTVSDVFYNGNQLLNFHLCGRHNTFDIHKHLMGKLSDNCKSFKIKCCSKKSFDHNKAQLLYLDNKLIDYINDNEELIDYNEYDVLATAVLFCKYREALENIEATKQYSYDLHNIKTVGSLIYKVFEENKNKKNYKLPKLTYKQYDDLQKSKIAGRVELFNGVVEILEKIVSTDVCSLYPFVMAVLNVYYPCGDIVEVTEYKGDNEIGFYYCDIDQSNLKQMNLPNIYAKKSEIENDWSYDGVLENYLISNVMIGLLKKYNCKVTIKNGFIFTNKKKSCDMFDFLLDFMKAKNDQDTFKSTNNNDYNAALRETLKLLMNSLSGKVIEGLHTEKTEDINSIAEYEKIKNKSETINFINAIGNKLFITYEVNPEKIFLKQQRPIYLGVLIYDYAKRYMYEYSYSKVGLDELLYTDTDASKFRYKRFLDWKNWIDNNNVQVPHWPEVEKVDERYKNHKIFEYNSKVFGSFEDELEGMDGDNYVFYALEKKSWLYGVDNKSKFRFKGLNDAAQLLTLQEDFIDNKTIKHKNGENEIKYFIKNDENKNMEEEVYKYYNNHIHNNIGNNNQIKFFKQLYDTKEAYVLCSSFRKIVKNTLHNVEIDETDKYNNLMNKIQANYMIKHIKIK